MLTTTMIMPVGSEIREVWVVNGLVPLCDILLKQVFFHFYINIVNLDLYFILLNTQYA